MTYNYNKLWKLLIDKGVRKTQMRLQAGISTNILTKTGKVIKAGTVHGRKSCM